MTPSSRQHVSTTQAACYPSPCSAHLFDGICCQHLLRSYERWAKSEIGGLFQAFCAQVNSKVLATRLVSATNLFATWIHEEDGWEIGPFCFEGERDKIFSSTYEPVRADWRRKFWPNQQPFWTDSTSANPNEPTCHEQRCLCRIFTGESLSHSFF